MDWGEPMKHGCGPMKQAQAHVAESESFLRGSRKDSQLEPAFSFSEFQTEGRKVGKGVWSRLCGHQHPFDIIPIPSQEVWGTQKLVS